MGHSQFVTTMVVYSAVVNPGLNWIRAPGRFSRSMAILYSIGFLIAIASVSIGLEVANNPPNYYSMLDVSRDCSFNDIKKAYRLRSVELHPDKNPSPTAAEDFNRLRVAYDVLSDSEKRSVYDFYGEAAALSKDELTDVARITSLLSYYIVWGILTYVMTLGDVSDVRAWSYSGCLLMFVAEINITLAKACTILMYELVQFMHLLYPPFMNGCRTMGSFFVRNILQENYNLSMEIIASNKTILMGMRQLQGELQGVGHVRRAKTDKREPADAASNAPTPQEQELIQPAPAVQPWSGLPIPGFVYAIGFYLVMNYIFG
ncbi:hypothetical protein ACHHYP_09881 [Achlya hypogyna]|uniref:J domain-containing protein n=1 Tax=Achlya hypogyna TaxID=1202772 RepID=A0A1V9ZIQ1_ACHHY|nr:hypothetical protein ACHHYP_09881 [Achlya hypogyna]